MSEKYFGYLLLQAADEQRGECLNVGVLVFDRDGSDLVCRTTGSLDRIERNLPNIPIHHLRILLDQAESSASDALAHLGPQGIAELSERSSGALRFTQPRSILARHMVATADDLLRRYVEMPEKQQTVAAASTSGASDWTEQGGGTSSRRVIRAIRTRLARYDFQEGRDYETAVTVEAKTESNLTVPVWFPLRIRKRLYVDGMDVKMDLNKTADISRVIGQKVAEAHRARPNAEISVFIRDQGEDGAGEMAEAVIRDGAGRGGEVLVVSRYSHSKELDTIVNSALAPRFL